MLYIRTDINEIIATGHLMRCIAIADAAKQLGEDVTFILADEQGKDDIEKRGYSTIILHTKWSDMEAELEKLQEIIKQYNITSMLVDSYQVTERYLKELSRNIKILYIDDWAREHYSVSALICYMSHWKTLKHKECYFNAKLMLGLAYAPVRSVFQNLGEKEIRSEVENVLLLSGGTDNYDMLSKMLGILKTKEFKEIVAICGRYYANTEALIEEYRDYENIRILRAVENIEDYMQEADLAISAGGTTLYELCACGTPTISYAIVDNQIENVNGFAQEGIIEYAGDVRYDDVLDNINELVDKYRHDRGLRKMLSKSMQLMVDGNGASRIVEEWKRLLKE